MGAAGSRYARSRMSRQRVYFIKPIGMDGPIKIGCSGSPNRRRKALATWSPFALEIVAEIEGNYQLERRFHAKHLASHQRNEWFAVTPELLADIAAIASGQFDIESLPAPAKLPSQKGDRGGRKWTAEERAACLRRNAVRKAEKQSGLVSPYGYTDPRMDDFIADPAKHGITLDERKRRWDERYLAMRMEAIERDRQALIQRTKAMFAEAAA